MPGFVNRPVVCLILAIACGVVASRRLPFPEDHSLVQLIAAQKPYLFAAIKWSYMTMLFTTPLVALSVVTSLGYIFLGRSAKSPEPSALPPYPAIANRKTPYVVLGEVHHAKKPVPAHSPRWLVIPERGLYTGIAIFGAIGSGKTSGCIYPLAEQLFGYKAADADKRIGGLVLEVKGDFCHKVKGILDRHGRADDYFEISLDCEYRFNHSNGCSCT